MYFSIDLKFVMEGGGQLNGKITEGGEGSQEI